MIKQNPLSTKNAAKSEDAPFDFIELWLVLWPRKWIIFFSTVAFVTGVVFYVLTLPNIYQSTALLSPQQKQASNSLSSLAGQFGGLASMAGINLDSGANNDVVLNIEIMKSKDFIYKFIAKQHVKIPLMAAEKWVKQTNKLLIDKTKYSTNTKKWVRKVPVGEVAEPSMFDTYEKFMENLTIDQDKSTGLVSIAFKFIDPNLSKKWVNYLIADINQLIRQQKILENKKSIAYLQQQLGKTNVTEMKNVFYSIIEEQTKQMLLAEVQMDYAFKVIENPIVEERKVAPKRAVIVILSAIASFFFMSLLVLFIHFIRRYTK